MISVPFLNMTAPYHELKDELDTAYHRVMELGWYIVSKEIEAFDQGYVTYEGTNA